MDLNQARGRIACFLLSGLHASKDRYQQAIAAFSEELAARGVAADTLSEAQLDIFLAEYILDLFEGSEDSSGISFGATVIAAMQKVNPRHKYTTAWKVLEVWRLRCPPAQAAAFPPELALGSAVWLVLMGQPVVGTVMLLCFTGLFRASELLHLTFQDFCLSSAQLVVILGVTKRGLEQKVLLQHPSVLTWCLQYLAYWMRSFPHSPADRVFPISFQKLQYWLRKATRALGFSDSWSSHGLRRGGATELFRLRVPLNEIALQGRWLSERSMHEYLRRGEVALLRLRSSVPLAAWQSARRFASLGPHVWQELSI